MMASKEVDFSLFIKDNHGVTLTKKPALIPAIRNLLNADEEINQEIASLKGAQVGTIRIGTYLSCSIHWIPKIIREFQKSYPDIRFKIIEGTGGDLAEWIENRRVDIGFISYQKNQRYQFLPVMDDELYALCDYLPHTDSPNGNPSGMVSGRSVRRHRLHARQ